MKDAVTQISLATLDEANLLPSEFALMLGNKYAKATSNQHKKELGQFFTPLEIGRYLSSLSTTINSKINILDPGFGLGILSCLLIEHIVSTNSIIEEVTLDAYEIDASLIPYTQQILNSLDQWLSNKNINFKFNLIEEDFIVSNSSIWHDTSKVVPLYDIVLSNPPYFKLPKDDIRNKLAGVSGLEQPNIYSLFIVLSTILTKPNGELIFIIPRSFCSGPYYERFRRFILKNLSFQRFHLFHSRSQAFKKDAVLQENIIFKAVKNQKEVPSIDASITITSSDGAHDFENSNSLLSHLDELVDLGSKEKVIFLPTTEDERQLISKFKNWRNRLDTFGISVSTGPIVAFRSTKDLSSQSEENTAPLLWIDNIKKDKIDWPIELRNKPQHIITEKGQKAGLLISKNYVLLRRFSSKDDSTRLVAAPYLFQDWATMYIGLENKLNYIYSRKDSLTKEQTIGLTALLNSKIYDSFFRIFNGNTQVSATEARALPMPTMKIIEDIGKSVLEDKKHNVDKIVSNALSSKGEITKNVYSVQRQESFSFMTLLEPNPKISLSSVFKQSNLMHQKSQKEVEADEILKAFGIKISKRNRQSALTLLSLCRIQPNDTWADATNNGFGISLGISPFIKEYYEVEYATNTRESFRKTTLYPFEDAGLITKNSDNSSRVTTSGQTKYAITPEALSVIKTHGTTEWHNSLSQFLGNKNKIIEKYAFIKSKHNITIALPSGETIILSPGLHNQLQRAIVEEFLPEFAKGAQVLYIGDTKKRDLVIKENELKDLKIKLDVDTKLPDVILHLKTADKNWIYLIEAVASGGPIEDTRKNRLKKFLEHCPAKPVFVTAFPTIEMFRRYSAKIAWETEVWIMDNPKHMIHFNGDKFLGPHK